MLVAYMVLLLFATYYFAGAWCEKGSLITFGLDWRCASASRDRFQEQVA